MLLAREFAPYAVFVYPVVLLCSAFSPIPILGEFTPFQVVLTSVILVPTVVLGNNMLGFIGVTCFKLIVSKYIIPVLVMSVTANDNATAPVAFALNICWKSPPPVGAECFPPTTAPKEGVMWPFPSMELAWYHSNK